MDISDSGLTPEQIKMLTLQFMGQHLTGDLKELDKNLVAKNNTLQGMVLNPTAVINSIPSIPTPVQSPPVQQQYNIEVPPTALQQVQAPIAAPAPPSVVVAPTQQSQPVDQNQLEFNFETSPLSIRIFEALERIEKKLSFIENRLSDIEEFKKKD